MTRSRERFERLQDQLHGDAFIGGAWHAAPRTFTPHSPIDGDPLAPVADCGAKEAAIALEAASEAFAAWRARSAFERSAVLEAWRDLIVEDASVLAQLTSLEMGKPLREATSEAQGAARAVDWASEEAKRIYGETIPSRTADKHLWTIKQPMGVVLGITPWNYPISMVTRKAAPALAAGCAIIVKPAEQTPLTALHLAHLWQRAGGPDGVFQVVPTNDPGTLTDAILADDRVRKVTFTGSTRVGTELYAKAAAKLKRVSLELGGHAPFIVFEDADLEAAAKGILSAKFSNAGQTCISANRIFVHEAIAGAFADAVAASVRDFAVGDPFDEATRVGPLVNAAAVTKVMGQVEDARAKGARVVTGGRADGLYMAPTILSGVSPAMELFRTETFGPVLPIVPFRAETDAVEMANHTQYGLAAYFWTASVDRVMRVAAALDYGIIGANDASAVQPQAPFGGLKASGVGREGGKWAVEQYLDLKYVSLKVSGEPA